MYSTERISKPTTSSGIGILVVSLAALFYCYEYLLRVAPSVMNAELMQHYQINDFSLVASPHITITFMLQCNCPSVF